MVDSTVHPLKVPSGSESGLKVQVNKDIKPNQTYVFTLDFDAHKSVVKTGNNQYLLKPVVKLVP